MTDHHFASRAWSDTVFTLDYHGQEDFLALPESCPDAASDSTAKLSDTSILLMDTSLLMSTSPPRQVPDLGWLTLSQPTPDQDPQVRGDQAPHNLPLGPQYWSQGLQDTQVVLQVPQGLQQEAPESLPLPHLSPEALQEVPLLSPGTSVGGVAHTPPPPPGRAGGRKARRPSKTKRSKLYEQTEKLDDPVLEKRRLDAINSKKNRDRRKESLAQLRHQVEDFTAQRNRLQQDVEDLRQREAQLLQQLQARPTLPHLTFTPPVPQPSSTPPLPHLSATPPLPYPSAAPPPPPHASLYPSSTPTTPPHLSYTPPPNAH